MRNRCLARAVAFAALAALAGLAAGCSGSSSSSGAAGPASTIPKPAATASAPPLAPIVEPFDPGHPARTRTAPADCGSQPSTLAIEQCYEIKTENTDAQIDTALQHLYDSTTASNVRTAIVTQEAAWLAARGAVCQAAFNTGGTIDVISVSACLLQESTARLAAVTGATVVEDVLKSTDSIDPNELSWYTTPEGSRIAEIDTQGDQTGGVVVSWVIIGGAQGFVVNPKQFYYSDGSFTDPGILQGTSFTYHTVKTGVMYQFDIDYSLLSHDPNAGQGTGGFVYAPGTPVAIWK